MANIVDKLVAWWIERGAFADRYRASLSSDNKIGVRSYVPMFLPNQGPIGYQAAETVDIDKAYRAAVVSSWAYASISLIVSRVSSDSARPIPQRLENGKYADYPEHPFTLLLKKPNAMMTGAFLMRYVAWWYLLSGNAYVYVSTDRPGRGEPRELWPLVARKVTPRPDRLRDTPYGPVIDYEYEIDGVIHLLPGEHVIHFRTANPWDYWRGLSPLTAAALPIEVDLSRARWDRDFFARDNAIPAAIISLPADISDVDFDRAQEQLRSEFGGKRRTAITRAGELTVQTVQQTIAEMQLTEGREFNRKEIERIFGIPEGLLGSHMSGESRLSAETALAVNTVQPLIDYFAEEWSAGLALFYGDDFVCRAPGIVPRDRALAVQEYTIYALDRTINANREEQGLPKLSHPLAAEVPVRLLQYIAPGYASPVVTPEPEAQVGSMADADAPSNVLASEAEKNLSLAEIEGIRAELARWRTVAKRSLRSGGRAGDRQFVSSVLPSTMARRIQDALKNATSEADVVAIFEEVEYDLLDDGLVDLSPAGTTETAGGHAPQLVYLPCPLCGATEVDQYLDHGGLCVCRSCEATFDPASGNSNEQATG